MGWCTLCILGTGGLGTVGWALAFTFRRRATRYRAAFDRAFAIAGRAYNFSGDEKKDLTRILREPIEGP